MTVSSVFGRTGAVVAVSGDYTVAEVTGAAPLVVGVETASITGTHSTPAIGSGTPAFEVGNYTATGPVTITIPSPVAGQSFELFVTQGGSGGYAVAFAGGSITWLPSAPVPNNTLGEIDQYMFTALTSSTWIGEWVTSNPTVITPGLGQIAIHQYAPASPAQYATSSTSLAIIDATNLTIAFTAPSSGKVLVSLTGCVYGTGETVTRALQNALFDHTSHAQVGWTTPSFTGSGFTETPTSWFYVTRLTPGNTYQYDWAWCVPNGGTYDLTCVGATGNLQGVGGNPAFQGPAIMQVFASN